ncbi:MAG: hypothetical protein ACYDB4_13075 [Candidatus Dormibacteraceae bacterium]
MEPVKVPQHLELEDVIAWGLGAVDLMCVAVGAAAGWWLYEFLPGDLDIRIGAAVPLAVVGLGLGVMRFGDLALRDWIALGAQYAMRPRRLLVGGGR